MPETLSVRRRPFGMKGQRQPPGGPQRPTRARIPPLTYCRDPFTKPNTAFLSILTLAALASTPAQAQWSTENLSIARRFATAVSVGDLAFFAGGQDALSSQTRIDVYNGASETWEPTLDFTTPRFAVMATRIGNYVMFAGGALDSATQTNLVEVYDSSIGPPSDPQAWSATTLSAPRGGSSAVSVGGKALFAGGTNMLSAAYDTVDIYDAATSTWDQDPLPVARGSLSAVALGNTVLFAGGLTGGFVSSKVVDTLNVGTGYWSSSQPLSVARADMGATTVAGKALFAGGSAGFGQPKSEVDIYEPLGLNYCVAGPNSTGCAASISGIGGNSLASNFLVLTTNCVPSNVFIYFFAPNQQPLPFDNGNLCVSGPLTRILPPGVAGGGVAQAFIDPASVGITTPGPRNFQCWFRDPAAGGAQFDTSDAIAITFVP